MNLIDVVRADREDLARVLKKHKGIRKTVEELYPDSAHFIYELLQNAEDTSATEAVFSLSDDELRFEHDGRPFDEKDIWAITDIGEGTKAEDSDQIGRFGVGFKAVFAYSETPHIWSPTYSFKITDLVLPHQIETVRDLSKRTRFTFPFDNPKKPQKTARDEIAAGLEDLAETTLLFLSHLDSIAWRIGPTKSGEVLRIQHSENHLEVLRQSDGKNVASSHFLRFSQPVRGLEKQQVSIAFALDFLSGVSIFDSKKPLANQLRIVPAEPGRVAVFFPAKKETSGLRFHLHAPFVTGVSRESVKETPLNDTLFEQLAELTTKALHSIRDMKLLTGDFLGALPIENDASPRYEIVRKAIVEEMNTKSLTPTHAKSHAPACTLFQAKAQLKDLLSIEDLKFLVKPEGDPQWALGASQKNSNQDKFLSSLAITPWDINHFVEAIQERAADGKRWLGKPPWTTEGPDRTFLEWLAEKSNEWHQELYCLLFDELAPEGRLGRLSSTRIVRLTDGTYATGGTCFFSTEETKRDDAHPRVAPSVYHSGKSKVKQEKARKFLEAVGVREIGEADEVAAILKSRYNGNAESYPNDRNYRRDLKRFMDLVSKEPNCASMFSDSYVFRIKKEDDQYWAKARQVFLDSPYLDTDLGVYYETMRSIGHEPNRFPLADIYREPGVNAKHFEQFTKALGVQHQLQALRVSVWGNASREYLLGVGGERETSPINQDFTFEYLTEVLKRPTVEVSRLLWRTMISLPRMQLSAEYQRSARGGSRIAPSTLVHILRTAAWVPQKDGIFVTPAEASRSLLPKGFQFDEGFEWLKVLEFGEKELQQSATNTRKQEAAKALGFKDPKNLERAQQFAALPPDLQSRILDEYTRRQQVKLPDNKPSNPERRAERVAEKAINAPGRTSEQRTKSVSVNQPEVKDDADSYLRRLYTNIDEETICQVCKIPLPFKLASGEYYFEKIQFLADLDPSRLHFQNHLALCPNHAAMFKHANGSRDVLRGMLLELDGNALEVVLAEKEDTIYFNSTHVADLKAIMNGGSVNSNENGDEG